MARAAGGGRDYQIAVIDTYGEVRAIVAGFPSVTTIIHDADTSSLEGLMGWASNTAVDAALYLASNGYDLKSMDAQQVKAAMKKHNLGHRAKKESAAARGTNVHEWAESLLLGKMTEADVRAAMADVEEPGYGEAMLKWHREFTEAENIVHATEQTLVSLTYEFAGTLDLLYEEPGGRLIVADFKTAKSIYDSHVVQCDAYAICVEEMRARSGKPVEVGAVEVIRFGADGKVQRKQSAPRPGVFLAMVDLYRARQGRKES